MKRYRTGILGIFTVVALLTLAIAVLPAVHTSAQDSTDLYVVQPGDTLNSIAQRFGTTPDEIIRLNNLPPTGDLVVGQAIHVPAGTGMGGILQTLPSPAPLREGSAPGFVPAPNTARNVGFSIGVEVNLDAPDPAFAAASVQDLGVGWIKINVRWKDYEAVQGAIDLPTLDSQIAPALDAGLNVLITLSGAPTWARATDELDGPPTDVATFGQFVGAIAARYRGRIAAYEIWDQPNLRENWAGVPLSAAGYVNLLRTAYTVIKNVDPSALVISAGLAPTGINDGVNAIGDRQYLRDAYAAGLPAFADAVGAHPFGWANPPDSSCCEPSPGVTDWYNDRSFYFRDTLTDYRRIMVEENDGARFIWVTRFGWGSSDGVVSEVNQVGRDVAFYTFVDEEEQADYIVRGFEVGRRLGFVGPMFVTVLNGCEGRAPGTPDFAGCYYSLIDANRTVRPAYEAVKAMEK